MDLVSEIKILLLLLYYYIEFYGFNSRINILGCHTLVPVINSFFTAGMGAL